MESTCLCKAVTVKIDDDELFTKPRGHLCHCLNCRKTSGSAFGSNLMIEESKVTITGQEHLKDYKDKETISGNTVTRSFCGTCGKYVNAVFPTATHSGSVEGRLCCIVAGADDERWESTVLLRVGHQLLLAWSY